MEDLLQVFEEREDIFSEHTLKIFKLINSTLVSVTKFLTDVDPMCATGVITWEDATLSDDMVVLVGIVDQEPGTTIETENGESSITEDNMEYFQRVVHMSLPFDLVKEANEEAITEFLYAIRAENQAEDDVIAAKQNKNDIEFDLSKLSPEQRKALQLFNTKEKN